MHPMEVRNLTPVTWQEQSARGTCYCRCPEDPNEGTGYATHYCVEENVGFCGPCARRIHNCGNFKTHTLWTDINTCDHDDCEDIIQLACVACGNQRLCWKHSYIIHAHGSYSHHELRQIPISEQYFAPQEISATELRIEELPPSPVPVFNEPEQAEQISEVLESSVDTVNNRKRKAASTPVRNVRAKTDESEDSILPENEEQRTPLKNNRPQDKVERDVSRTGSPLRGPKSKVKGAIAAAKKAAKKQKPVQPTTPVKEKTVRKTTTKTISTKPNRIVMKMNVAPCHLKWHVSEYDVQQEFKNYTKTLASHLQYLESIIGAKDLHADDHQQTCNNFVMDLSTHVGHILSAGNFLAEKEELESGSIPLPPVALLLNPIFDSRQDDTTVRKGSAPGSLLTLPSQICNIFQNGIVSWFQLVPRINDKGVNEKTIGICFAGSKVLCKAASLLASFIVEASNHIYDRERIYRLQQHTKAIQRNQSLAFLRGISAALLVSIYSKVKIQVKRYLISRDYNEFSFTRMSFIVMQMALKEFNLYKRLENSKKVANGMENTEKGFDPAYLEGVNCAVFETQKTSTLQDSLESCIERLFSENEYTRLQEIGKRNAISLKIVKASPQNSENHNSSESSDDAEEDTPGFVPRLDNNKDWNSEDYEGEEGARNTSDEEEQFRRNFAPPASWKPKTQTHSSDEKDAAEVLAHLGADIANTPSKT